MVLIYDERVKGWISFHSYTPDFTASMNNKFFTAKNGELYIHDSQNVDMNNFYGEQYTSKISLMVNQEPSVIKQALALSLEGNESWDAIIQAYVSSMDNPITSTIDAVEFIKKEGIWYAYTRRNESETHFDSKSTYGVGRVISTTPTNISFNGGNSSLTVGDKIVKGSNLQVIGTITGYNPQTNILTMSATTGLVVNDFILGMKDPRVEGGGLRGYTFRVDLENDSTEKVELFSVNTEVIRSYS